MNLKNNVFRYIFLKVEEKFLFQALTVNLLNFIKVSIKLKVQFIFIIVMVDPDLLSTLIGCWQLELVKRPDINQVISELNDIGSEDHNVNSESNSTSSNFNSRETEVLDDFSDCYL